MLKGGEVYLEEHDNQDDMYRGEYCLFQRSTKMESLLPV